MQISLNRSNYLGKSRRHLARTISLTLTASLLFSGLSFFTIHSANAADPSVALPISINSTTSFATVSGVSVSNYTTVQATISVTAGNIKLSTTSGLTAPTGYSSADWTSNSSTVIAFSGTQANVNSALATLQYKATAIGTADTITVATFASGAAFDASSGRIYEVVNNGTNINWELARCKAKYSNSDVTYSGTSTLNDDRCTSSTTLTRRTSSGLKGYLATITSLAEHEFLKTKLNDVGWIGGADTDSEGTFIWMDGPEAGQVFFTPGQSSRRGSFTVSGSVPGFSYGENRFNYFSNGEPNNSGGAEDFAEFGFGNDGDVGRSWNDCQNACGRSKYVIEYGGEGGETLQGASGTIAVRTAPTAPTSVSPTAGALQASLTWAAPSSAGGTPVTGYLVEYKASGGSWVTATANTGSATTSYTVTGLSAGTTYTFRVSAINNAGTSAASTESSGVSINKANQSITFSSLGTSSKTYPYSQVLSMSTSGSTGAGGITFAIVAGGSATSCTLSNSSASATITASTSGTCLVAATIATDANYNAATSSNLTFSFAKAAQSAITITTTAATYGSNLTLASSGGSTGDSYNYSKVSGNCSLSGAVLTPTATGSCVVQSNLAANVNYLAETSTATTITISSGSVSASLTLAPGNLTFRQAKNVTAVATVAGKITFRVAGKILPGCKNKAVTEGNSFTAICSYRPSNHSYVTISATLNPTDNFYIGTVTNSAQYLVTRRTGPRAR